MLTSRNGASSGAQPTAAKLYQQYALALIRSCRLHYQEVGREPDPEAIGDAIADVVVAIASDADLDRLAGHSLFIRLRELVLGQLGLDWQQPDGTLSPVQFEQSTLDALAAQRYAEQEASTTVLDEVVETAIGELPPRKRQIFLLRYHDDYLPHEIAAMLNTSASNVSKRLYFIRMTLQQAIKDDLSRRT